MKRYLIETPDQLTELSGLMQDKKTADLVHRLATVWRVKCRTKPGHSIHAVVVASRATELYWGEPLKKIGRLTRSAFAEHAAAKGLREA